MIEPGMADLNVVGIVMIVAGLVIFLLGHVLNTALGLLGGGLRPGDPAGSGDGQFCPCARRARLFPGRDRRSAGSGGGAEGEEESGRSPPAVRGEKHRPGV